MTTQVTLSLPDETYRRAERLARLTGRQVNDVLADTIHISLQPLGPQAPTGKPVVEMSDAEVLTVADSQMDVTQDRRFSDLLNKQQAGILADNEQPELLALMQVYQEGLLRKAQALKEAVHRGLREPLEP